MSPQISVQRRREIARVYWKLVREIGEVDACLQLQDEYTLSPGEIQAISREFKNEG